jgi:hypothetical protein
LQFVVNISDSFLYVKKGLFSKTVSKTKMAVSWVVGPFSLAIAVKMEAASTSETSVKLLPDLHGATTQKTAIFLLTAVRT